MVIRKLLAAILPIFLFTTLGYSQTYVISNGTQNTCGGVFVDTGGSSGDYGTFENFEMTFCSTNAVGDTHVSIFFAPSTFAAGDLLCFYDGTDSSGPSLGCQTDYSTGDGFIVQATAANPSGCITVTWESNGGTAPGWVGTISCVQQCQTVLADLVMSTPIVEPADTGWIDICPGDVVTFNGGGVYPQNNLIYNQSDNTSVFEWDFGDGSSAFGPNVTHQYNTPGGYIVELFITDQAGCRSTNFIKQRIRVSGPPIFNITDDLPSNICVGDTIKIFTGVESNLADISVIPGEGSFQAGGTVADSIGIPDGTGETYFSCLTLNDFNPGQTLPTVDDLLGICVIMEHSYLGDLEIEITCPSGQSIILHEFSNFGGGGYYLGEPIEGDDGAGQDPDPGLGYEYCWVPNAPNGTWLQTPPVGGILPAGDYSSFENLSGLVGCTLNGEWCISIQDLWGIDNGVIFSWELELNDALYPNLETFNLDIVDQQWLDDPSIIINDQDSLVASPQFPGAVTYTFQTTDNFGCVYDTTINITVLPQTHPNCFNCTGNLIPIADQSICADQGEFADLTTDIENVELTEVTFQSVENAPFTSANFYPVNPYSSTVNVTGLPYATITNTSIQEVCINIDHNFLNDVVVYLQAPNGTVLELTTNNGITSDNYTQTCFSPTATDAITTGSAPFTGSWLPEGDFNSLIGSQSNGNWTLLVGDQFGGFDSGVLLNWNITFNLDNTLSYSWSPTNGLSCTDCNNPTANPTTTTTYTVTATDLLGCSYTETVTVTAQNCTTPCTLTAALGGTTDISCFGDNDGTVTITSLGAIGDATYVLDGTDTQVNNGVFTGIGPGAHSVVITDDNACTETINFTINEPIEVIVNLNLDSDVLCFGGNEGSITATGSGGDGTISYVWSDPAGQVTPTATGLTAGTYTVTVTDGQGCSVTASETVSENPALTVSPSTTPVSCFGGNDGTATVTPAGGTGTYTYAWDDASAQNTPTATGLTAGTYTVTVTDSNGCDVTTSGTVIEPLTPVVVTDVSQTFISCFGDNGGIAAATASGGTGALSYAWSSSANTSSIETNLAPGTYTVTATDVNGCSATGSVTIIEHTEVTVMIAETNVSCFGGSDGTATATAMGGSPGYTYLWDNPSAQVGVTATGLTAGTYTVTATDINNCTGTASVTIQEPIGLTIVADSTMVSCNGGADGSASILVSGGTPGYTYAWSDPAAQSTPTATGLSTGLYFVTITDGLGCTFVEDILVEEPTPVSGTTSFTNVSCFQGNDGTASVVATGGTAPYTYLWSDPAGQNGATAVSLAAGTYTVTITDANLCTATANATIIEPATAVNVVSVEQTTIACSGSNGGAASVIVSGGTPGYTYAWSSGGTTNVELNLPPGTYTVTATDANSCTATGSVTIVEYAPLSASSSGVDVTCFGGNNGSASVNLVSGGAGNGTLTDYSYAWSGTVQTGSTAVNLPAGTYVVTISDIAGCTTTNSVTISEPSELIPAATSGNLSCANTGDGFVEVAASGGTPPYSFQWNGAAGNSTDAMVTNLNPGNYIVTVTDANGCNAVASTIVEPVIPVSISFNVDDNICFGYSGGLIDVNVDGGTPGYTYIWSTGDTLTTDTLQGLQAGTYDVTVVDANGCEVTGSTNVGQPTPVQFSATAEDVTCFGNMDGEIAIEATGGTYPYTYSIDSVNYTGAAGYAGLAPGTYNLNVIDANGCTAPSQPITINEPAEVFVGITVDSTMLPLTLGDSVELGVFWGNTVGDVQIDWTGLYGSDSLSCTDCVFTWVNDFENNRYTVTVIDENGCYGEAEIEIIVDRQRSVFVPSGMTVNNDDVNDVLMVHGSTGTKVLTFRVYDRWGEMLFRADDYDINSTAPEHVWDGTFKGKIMNSAVFVWYVEVEYIDGRRESFEGNTTLLR